MSNDADLLSGAAPEELFEVQRRGYDRGQVEEFVAHARRQAADQQERLTRALSQVEQLRGELAATREQAAVKPAHEEVSERIAQILRLAADEATAQKERAADEIAAMRTRAEHDAKARQAEADSQAERILAAAREQADRTTASARADADKTVKAAKAEAAQALYDAREQAATTTSTAAAQAKQALDEATARAAAIRDGAENRLSELVSGHTQAVRQLTEVHEVLSGLLARDGAMGTLHDQVAKTAAATLAATSGQPARAAAGTRRSPDAKEPPADRGQSAARSATPRPAQDRPHPAVAGQQAGRRA
jgi:cell division septum initiation protein DivIVA